MSYLFLIPVSIGMALIGLAAFFWALRHDQFDDPDGAGARILPCDEDDAAAAAQAGSSAAIPSTARTLPWRGSASARL